MQSNLKIKTLSDLRRRKRILNKQLRLRGKILDARLRRFEQNLTIPNITRELFRGSRLELIAPLAASYIADKFKSGKSLITLIGGFLAGLGSTFSLLKRKKHKQKAVNERKFHKPEEYKEEQMFI